MALIGIGCSPVLMAAYYIFARIYSPAVFGTLAGAVIGFGSLGNILGAAPLAAPAVATSLAAFAVVYFTVFGAGVFYILRLMSHAPHRDEPGVAETPIRTAGITPAPAIDPDRPIPTGEETDHER